MFVLLNIQLRSIEFIQLIIGYGNVLVEQRPEMSHFWTLRVVWWLSISGRDFVTFINEKKLTCRQGILFCGRVSAVQQQELPNILFVSSVALKLTPSRGFFSMRSSLWQTLEPQQFRASLNTWKAPGNRFDANNMAWIFQTYKKNILYIAFVKLKVPPK